MALRLGLCGRGNSTQTLCIIHNKETPEYDIQKNFSGSNTDGSFTMAFSNSCLSPLEKIP